MEAFRINAGGENNLWSSLRAFPTYFLVNAFKSFVIEDWKTFVLDLFEGLFMSAQCSMSINVCLLNAPRFAAFQ